MTDRVPRTAAEVLNAYIEALDWDFEIISSVLTAYLREAMIEPLTDYIQVMGGTDAFEEFLLTNFGGELADEQGESADESDDQEQAPEEEGWEVGF